MLSGKVSKERMRGTWINLTELDTLSQGSLMLRVSKFTGPRSFGLNSNTILMETKLLSLITKNVSIKCFYLSRKLWWHKNQKSFSNKMVSSLIWVSSRKISTAPLSAKQIFFTSEKIYPRVYQNKNALKLWQTLGVKMRTSKTMAKQGLI